MTSDVSSQQLRDGFLGSLGTRKCQTVTCRRRRKMRQEHIAIRGMVACVTASLCHVPVPVLKQAESHG